MWNTRKLYLNSWDITDSTLATNCRRRFHYVCTSPTTSPTDILNWQCSSKKFSGLKRWPTLVAKQITPTPMLLIWKKWTLYGWKTKECKFILLARLIKDNYKGLGFNMSRHWKGKRGEVSVEWMGRSEGGNERMNKWMYKWSKE